MHNNKLLLSIEMTNERISYIDLGAGIMILWMVLGHTVGTATGMEIALHDLWQVTDASLIPEGVHAIINREGKIQGMGLGSFIPSFLFFFMPWFFYKSGQFFHKRSIKDEWKKDWNKLMRQFLIWSAIGYVLFITFRLWNGGLTLRSATYSMLRSFFLNGYIDCNLPLWFLFSLFIVRQVANIILPQEGDSYYWQKCICIILSGFGMAIASYCLNLRLLPLYVANSSAGLAYFTFGYCLRNHETKWWLLVPCIMVYVACCIWGFPGIDMRSNSCANLGKYLITIPCCCAGIVTFNMFWRLVSKYLHYLSLPFECVGKYAMMIYVSHAIIYKSVSDILIIGDFKNMMPYTFWIIIGAYVVFLPTICLLSNKIHRNRNI